MPKKYNKTSKKKGGSYKKGNNIINYLNTFAKYNMRHISILLNDTKNICESELKNKKTTIPIIINKIKQNIIDYVSILNIKKCKNKRNTHRNIKKEKNLLQGGINQFYRYEIACILNYMSIILCMDIFRELIKSDIGNNYLNQQLRDSMIINDPTHITHIILVILIFFRGARISLRLVDDILSTTHNIIREALGYRPTVQTINNIDNNVIYLPDFQGTLVLGPNMELLEHNLRPSVEYILELAEVLNVDVRYEEILQLEELTHIEIPTATSIPTAIPTVYRNNNDDFNFDFDID
jgi:hypothetical protein